MADVTFNGSGPNMMAQAIPAQMTHGLLEDNSGFITFMRAYYEWLGRNGGMTQQEQEFVLKTGLLGDYGTVDGELASEIDTKLSELKQTPSPGGEMALYESQYRLERVYQYIETNGGEIFVTKDDTDLEVSWRLDSVYQQWFDALGFGPLPESRSSGGADELLLIRLVKDLHAIKGTEQSMKLFFRLYFGTDITVISPKHQMCVVEENFDLDGVNCLRDDWYYQEYAYVIRVVDTDLERYKSVFEDIYLKYIHPSGFKVFLELA